MNKYGLNREEEIKEEIRWAEGKINYYTNKIYKRKLKLEKLKQELKSLIDEILYTNEIEGIISTRKEISEIIDTIKNNEKSKPNKIQSLINKYLK